MCLKAVFCRHRDRLAAFERAHDEVRHLDFTGKSSTDADMYCQYQRRNSFGLNSDMKIYRIFREEFYEKDLASGVLTLPLAQATIWKDPLENPLTSVTEGDQVTGGTIHPGSAVDKFYALCWTRRKKPTKNDWDSFSHEKPAVRIATTIGKLLDRVMNKSDSGYMNRHWLIDVDYMDTKLIEQMKNPAEVYGRMEPSGAQLALSAAIVRTGFSKEGEVRYLFDNGVKPLWSAVACDNSGAVPLIRLPFCWEGFVDEKIHRP
jgi:hypothetical protein